MAITIPSTKSGGLTGLRNGSRAGSAVTTAAVEKGERRIPLQRESAPTQLSAAGRIQSALAELRTASAAVAASKASTSDADIRKLADTFARTFNSAVEAARDTSPARGTAIENRRARATETELRRSVDTLASSADLRKLGIATRENGTLSIDDKVFNAALGADRNAVRAELSRVGRQVEQTAIDRLADGENVARAVKAPSDAAKSPEASRNDRQEMAAAARQTVSAEADRFNNNLPSGAAAYQRVFSL